MCGICGVIEQRHPVDPAVVIAMRDRLRHRGPDDDGLYVSPPRFPQVGLGFRRLAIIDLSGGQQPMSNEDGTIWIVFNGEIYNFRELRDELVARGHVFRTNSDTEAIVHCYEEFGEDCVQRFNGMFAFALWDERRQKLFAARDRMGKKPFHYAELAGRFLFASEVKALLQHPDFRARIDTESLTQYLAFEFVPAPRCIFASVRKLPAGHWLVWHNARTTVKQYWDLDFAEATPRKSVDACADELRERLRAAVNRRLVSDVPLGVFLSGGLDSSAVVALMAASMPPAQIKTFAIGFADPSFDESSYARLVARHFGTDHHEQILEPRKLIEILPAVTDFLDEPFGDASVVPTYLLAQFTRQHVTVALGGDGGDELFAGYPTFPAERLARVYEKLPRIVDASVRAVASRLPVSRDNFSFDFRVKQFLAGVPHEWAERNQVWLGSFPSSTPDVLHADLRSQLNGADPLAGLRELSSRCADTDWLNRLVYFYCKLYLQDDILFKVDRASMAASLEARAPFLDVEFVEFANSLPAAVKMRGLQTKYILKRALRGLVPSVILHRAKKGFGMPVAKWIRGDLRDMVRDLLAPAKIRREGFFDATVVNRLLQEHLDGVRDNRKQLWTLLMFEWWLERYGSASRSLGPARVALTAAGAVT